MRNPRKKPASIRASGDLAARDLAARAFAPREVAARAFAPRDLAARDLAEGDRPQRSVASPVVRLVRDSHETTETQVIALSDGATVKVYDGHVAELRDAGDRLLIRYENGRAEVAAPAGDLVFSAPGGRVVLSAGTDVVIEAARDLTQRAGHRADLEAPRLHVTAAETRLTTTQAAVVAERILTTARVLAHSVERFEVSAVSLVEKTRETYREAADLLQTRAGRLRTLVEDVYSLSARRTTIVSKEETSIDGKKVLLG